MRSIGVMSTTALFLLLGYSAAVDARQEKQEEKAPKQEQQAKPEKQQQAKAPKQEQQAKPEKQQQAKAPKQEQQAKPEKQQQAKAPKQEKQAKPEKQQEAKAPKQEKQAKPEKQEQQARSDKQQQQHSQQQASGQRQQQTNSSRGPQRTQQAMATQRSQPALRLSARGSGRIPDDRFRSSFGRGHEFRMGNPQMVDGYSRFRYGGYWFGFVDPWPVGWYYTDECYIDYVHGEYYMFNPYYPGARFSISVVI
jgi:hypothetical protein